MSIALLQYLRIPDQRKIWLYSGGQTVSAMPSIGYNLTQHSCNTARPSSYLRLFNLILEEDIGLKENDAQGKDVHLLVIFQASTHLLWCPIVAGSSIGAVWGGTVWERDKGVS